MKKQLMATTALVAAGVLVSGAVQAKPTLTLGGWFEGIVGYVDDDDPKGDHVAVDVQQDSEIHFNGNVTLDNGIKIRTRVELEGQSSNSSDEIDEAYIDVSGSFGAIRIGSEDSVAHLMTSRHQGSWGTQVGQNLQLDTGDWIEAPSGHRASTSVRLSLGDADGEKVTYFTPRIGGFQAGASYMPSFTEGNNGGPESTATANEGFSLGANYSGKFGGASIGVAAGYSEMSKGSGPSVSNIRPEGWGVSGSVGFGGFKIAAGYTDQDQASGSSLSAVDVGASYKAGMNRFSVAWVSSEEDARSAGDETDAIMASYRRDLAPGVQYRLNLIYADYSDGSGEGNDNEGMALTTSVRLAF